MSEAFEEAKKSYERGDFPVGACLVVNDKILGTSNNSTKTKRDWISHAETTLINKYSKELKIAKQEDKEIKLYTTLEPCLMCMGTIFFNRVDKVFFACKDPNGGVSNLNSKDLPPGYKNWPKIEQEKSLEKDSYDILVKYMRKNKTWKEVLDLFEKTNQRQQI